MKSLSDFIGQAFNWAHHGGKRQLMVPGGRLMAENDSSWESLGELSGEQISVLY
jgi:hypothetical protein